MPFQTKPETKSKSASSKRTRRTRDAKKSGTAATAGKRTSVKDASGLLSAPAQIMGPRLLFILSVVLLCALGLLMVYSASSITALNSADYGNDPAYFLKRQGIFLALGVAACVACALIPYRIWANKVVFVGLWGFTVLMLAATAAGLGVSALGAERSIMIAGFALQPAEFAKISVLLTCASLFEVQREYQFTITRFTVIFLVAAVVPLVLIYRQPDLGTAIILAVGILALMMLVGVPWFIIGGFVGVVALYVVFACITQPYHLQRIVTMFDPWLDPQGKGFQSIQSLYAFGSGGVTGTGLGLSRQKYLYLPYAHTDFIFAIIGEEFGLLGAASVVALFAFFIFAGMRISRSAPDVFGCSISGSMTVMIGFQACVNMACVTGIAPVTGKALPFISYGGSSLVATMIMAGIILSVSLRSKVGVEHEARRDNLFVIQGASPAAAAQAAGDVAARGLRVVGGLASRAGDLRRGRSANSRAQSSSRTRNSTRSSSVRTAAGRSAFRTAGRGETRRASASARDRSGAREKPREKPPAPSGRLHYSAKRTTPNRTRRK